MNAPWDPGRVAFSIDRSQSTPITAQITSTLRTAILDGRLRPGTRLPSWLDLAAQLNKTLIPHCQRLRMGAVA